MTKIVIEDMKFNKTRRKVVVKNETTSILESKDTNKDETRDSKKSEISGQRFNDAQTNIIEPVKKSYSNDYIEPKNKDEEINKYFGSKYKEKPRLQRTPQVIRRPKVLRGSVFAIFILCVLFGCIYWGGNVFQKADVTIISKHQLVSYDNKSFTASKDPTSGLVNFEIMITSSKKIKSVILTNSKEVSIKAKGSVKLYNEFSVTAVKLTSGTFLSDESGKTYKVDDTVTIPGYKKEGNQITPGEITANITSFLPGDAYNGSPSDFQVSSFKGTAKYKKIYGKLESPLVGGTSGLVYVLDDTTKNNIASSTQSSIKDDLIKQVKALVPPGYILYPDAMTFSFGALDDVISKTPEADISMNGSLSVVLIKEKSLMDYIIRISFPNVSSQELNEIKIPNLNKFNFSFSNKDQLIVKDMDTVSFTLSGNTDAVWNPNIEILKSKLLGVRNDSVFPIFREDKGVSSALVKIFPPWQKNVPNDISKINIITE